MSQYSELSKHLEELDRRIEKAKRNEYPGESTKDYSWPNPVRH